MSGTLSIVPVVATGDWITAGWVNTYLGGNIAALWVGSAAGDTEYYISAVEKARLAKPSVDSLFKMGSGGTPVWLPITGVPGLLHAEASLYFTGEQTNSLTSYVDKTGATVDIVTTRTCRIRMYAMGHFAHGNAGNRCSVRGVMGGVSDPQDEDTLPWTTNPYYTTFHYIYERTGVAAGTITSKLQFKGGGGSGYFNAGRILVEAFAE